jgi:hypothetical protein
MGTPLTMLLLPRFNRAADFLVRAANAAVSLPSRLASLFFEITR